MKIRLLLTFLLAVFAFSACSDPQPAVQKKGFNADKIHSDSQKGFDELGKE